MLADELAKTVANRATPAVSVGRLRELHPNCLVKPPVTMVTFVTAD